MIHNTNFSAFGMVGDCLYFSSIAFNGLFSMNIKDGTINFLSSFPDEAMNVGMLHRCATVYADKVIFVPYGGHCLSVYDTKKKSITNIRISEEPAHYIESPVIGDCLWLIPGELNKKVLKVNLLTFEINEQSTLSDEMLRLGNEYSSLYIVRTAIVDQYIWFSLYDSNVLACIDTETGKLQYRCLDVYNICSVCKSNNGLWIIPMIEHQLLLYNLLDERIDTYDVNSSGIVDGRLINYVFETDNSVFAIPANDHCIYKKNNTDKAFDVIFRFDDGLINRNIAVSVTTICAQLYRNVWIVPPIKYKNLLTINLENDLINEVSICETDFLNNEYLTEVYKNLLQMGCCTEGEMTDLNTFINFITK